MDVLKWCRLAAVTTGLIGAVAAPSTGFAKDKFAFAWPSAINSGVAPIMLAKELGYFAKEEIDLEVQVLTGSGVIIPQLMAGNIQGAYSSLEPLVIARQPGKPNYPIVFAYNYLRNSIWEFAVLKDSPIQSLSDMKGKSIGVLALSSGNIFMTRAMLEKEGVQWKDIKLLSVGTGAAAFEALKSNEIQILNLFDTAHVRLEQSGTPIRRIAPPPEFDGLSSHGISVTQKLLKENSGLVGRFGRALTKGTLACNANLEACVQAYWKAYPALRPSAANESDALEKEKEVLAVRMKSLTFFRPGEAKQMGGFGKQDWTQLIKALKLGGEVSNTQIPLDSLYTDALVPEYNRFDAAEVVEQARRSK